MRYIGHRTRFRWQSCGTVCRKSATRVLQDCHRNHGIWPEIYNCRYRSQRGPHRILIQRLITMTWLLPILHGIVEWAYLSIRLPVSYHYNHARSECSLPVDDPSLTFRLIILILPTILFMLIPTLFNIAAYSRIIAEVKKFQNHLSKRQVLTSVLAIRALLIALVNLLSWVPFILICQVFKNSVGNVEKKIAVLFLYINCIADPFLYVFMKKIISRMISWYSKFSTRIHIRIPNSKSSVTCNPISTVPELAINAANVISASGLFFEEDIVWSAAVISGSLSTHSREL